MIATDWWYTIISIFAIRFSDLVIYVEFMYCENSNLNNHKNLIKSRLALG